MVVQVRSKTRRASSWRLSKKKGRKKKERKGESGKRDERNHRMLLIDFF